MQLAEMLNETTASPIPKLYRKSISFDWVEKNAPLLMALEDGDVTYPKTSVGLIENK